MPDDPKVKLDYAPSPRSRWRARLGRLARWLAVAAGVIVGIVVMLQLSKPLIRQWNTWRVRNESIAILKQNRSSFAACAAKASYGMAWTFPDKNWVVIRCTSSPSDWCDDVSIAVDSAGGWYQGNLRCRAVLSVSVIPADSGSSQPPTDAAPKSPMEKAADLEAARQALLGMGFRPMDAPK